MEYDTRKVVGDSDVWGFCAWRRYGGSPTVREDCGFEDVANAHTQESHVLWCMYLKFEFIVFGVFTHVNHYILTAWPKEEVLGLSIDDGLIGMFGQRPIFVKIFCCHESVGVALFSLCLLVVSLDPPFFPFSVQLLVHGLTIVLCKRRP